MWRSAVFGEIPRVEPICLVCSPRASSRRTSTSRSVRPAGRSMRATGRPLASSTAATRSASKSPARHCSTERRGGAIGRHRLAVGPRLGHRVIGVDGREQTRRRRLAGRVCPTVIAGPVEPLVMRARDRCERRERRRPQQHPLGLVRVQPDLLPVVRRQRPGPVPDVDGCRDAPEVVHGRCATKGEDRGLVESAPPSRRLRERGDARRMAGEVGGGQVGEVAHRREGPVDRVALQGQPRAWLAGERLVPRRRARRQREDLRGVVREARGDRRVEPTARVLSHGPRSGARAAEHPVEGRVLGDVHDAHG